MIRVGLALGASWLGSVNYYRNLLNAVCAQPDRRLDPVLLIGEKASPDILDGLPALDVIRTPWLDQPSLRWVARKGWQQVFHGDPFLARLLRAHNIDVLSHSDFLGRRAACPAVCWIGDFQHRQQPEYFSRWERIYRDRDFRLQCRQATLIIVSSHDAQSALAEFDPQAVAKSRVLHFVAQPRVSESTPDRLTLEKRYGFEGPYFHVPNQFWAHKNHRLILDALALLAGQGERPLVISTGATEDYRRPRYFGELMAYAESIGVRDRFRTLGIVPYDDLVGLMVNAVALINPSRAEGWSTSVEEAKALGKRMILSNLPVHLEQAPPDGIFVDLDRPEQLADALRSALATFDPESEKVRSEQARTALPERVRAFACAYEDIVLEAASMAPARR